MTTKEYVNSIQKVVSENKIIICSDIHFEEISQNICYLKGKLEILDKSNLFFVEFVVINTKPFLEKYKYHWQDEDNNQLARWDNVKHHQHIPTFPHHYHDKTDKPFPSEPMTLEKILLKIEKKVALNL
ncbi:hypothetical protein H8E88_29440 [candidate division KSB1 bacterium]|nr:hypothetical protein [candidate division KSB1 bacterium]MBL7094037.1 hypothetical protein [candidate division KSB1 bacterium]